MSRVDVDGVGIEYEVTGEGRPVVLLHGFPDSGRLWRHQVPALAEAGFRVIVPDLRGYGRSDKPAAVDAYSIPLLAGDVLAVLADLGIGKATWWARLGARWPGHWPRSRRGAWITWRCCRSGTRSRSCARSSSGRSPGTCCCSSSPGGRAVAERRRAGPTSGPGAATRTPIR